MKLNGTKINPTGTYRVTVNSFLAAGGDNFFALGDGTNKVTTGDNDLTMLIQYLAANSPVTADTRAAFADRPARSECTTTITGQLRPGADSQHRSDLPGQRDDLRPGHRRGGCVADQ